MEITTTQLLGGECKVEVMAWLVALLNCQAPPLVIGSDVHDPLSDRVEAHQWSLRYAHSSRPLNTRHWPDGLPQLQYCLWKTAF